MSQKVYSYKMLKQITEQTAKKSTENVLYIVLAVLVDKYKFNDTKTEQFMEEVAKASRFLGEYLDREDLKNIIEKQTGLQV